MTQNDTPGSAERHQLRRRDNPLFDGVEVSEADLVAARAEDQFAAIRFLEEFQALVQDAATLSSNVESDAILRLAARLEEAYARCATLGSAHDQIQQAILRLLMVVQGAVRAAAGDDAQAQLELEQAEEARRHHFSLLEHPLVADLMLADSPISREELVPTLLSETPEACRAALWLFGPEQLHEMHDEGVALLERLRAAGRELPEAWEKLAIMRETAEVQ